MFGLLAATTDGNATAWIAFAAVISAAVIGGPIMWWLNRFRKENSEQHGIGVGLLMALIDEVKDLKHRFDEHIAEEHDLFTRVQHLSGGCNCEATSESSPDHDQAS